ncbi:MAG TPA: hypothetical protein VMT46_10590 [Anaerolineaceae bacterium]|nr:hypothetical protein [Anaerolineaceae bacterium]
MKIAILGAAGVRTPLIVQAMALRQKRIGLSELWLMDIDPERLDLIGALTAPIETSGRLAFGIHRTIDARQALRGADYVITTFRVGGIESRAMDERIPLNLGVLGQETTGPGGFAMAMRTIPVLLGYIDMMRELCPQAWLVNFANPAGLLAEVILREAGWKRAVGICDAPGTMQRAAAAMLHVPVEEVFLDYFGLNHLGWIRRIMVQERDYLPELLRMISRHGGIRELPFSADFLTGLGMIPNEYLYYYYNTRQSVGNILKGGESRGEQISRLNAELFKNLRVLREKEDFEGMQDCYQAYLDTRGGTYMITETGKAQNLADLDPQVIEAITSEGYAGVALDLIEALQGGGSRPIPLNILDQGAIQGMEKSDVVEVPAYIGKGYIRPLAVGAIPGHCLGLMKQVKNYERLTIEAVLEGSYAKAVQALTIHPLVADSSLAKSILDGYLRCHGDLFPTLA